MRNQCILNIFGFTVEVTTNAFMSNSQKGKIICFICIDYENLHRYLNSNEGVGPHLQRSHVIHGFWPLNDYWCLRFLDNERGSISMQSMVDAQSL